MTHTEFIDISNTIPTQPGIYKYYDNAEKLLYVGKAKNLRKRVSSYFNKTKTSYKTAELVSRIFKIEFTIVDTEQEAFLLENSLIKAHQPFFNINLKDDKTYPYIVVKNEPFPRVFFTRRKINDGSIYIGPFTSLGNVRDLLRFIKQNIQLRTCKLNLTENNIAQKKFKVCLEYHLGNCKAPCVGLQSKLDYDDGIAQLKDLLKGNLAPILNNYKNKIKEHAANLEFEKAAIYQFKIGKLQEYASKSTVVNTKTGTVDVFTIQEENDTAYVNYLAVNNGSIIKTKTITLQKKLGETIAEVLAFAVAQLRTVFESEAKEIILPFAIEYSEPDIMLSIPKAGDKKKLLDLSQKNVDYFKADLSKKKTLGLVEKTDEEHLAVLAEMQDYLQLTELPTHIECFDNSNFQGAFPVSAMVCFRNGMPSNKEYRHYNVKTVEGINDFASMAEVVYRRYKRLTDEGSSLPQLIIIDGGKGQLSSAMESIDKLNLRGSVTLVGLAKNKEEIFFVGDSQSLLLPWDSETLKLIRRIRDAVHRFGITFHRNKRSAGTFKNELESIKGIGKQTAELLLKEFKSVKKVKEASDEVLEKLIGKAKLKVLRGREDGEGK
jgi:excinuclease ABC subunit C